MENISHRTIYIYIYNLGLHELKNESMLLRRVPKIPERMVKKLESKAQLQESSL